MHLLIFVLARQHQTLRALLLFLFVIKLPPKLILVARKEYKLEDKDTLLELYDEMLQRWLNPGAFVETNRTRSTTSGGGTTTPPANGGKNTGGGTQEKVDAEKRTLHGTLFRVR